MEKIKIRVSHTCFCHSDTHILMNPEGRNGKGSLRGLKQQLQVCSGSLPLFDIFVTNILQWPNIYQLFLCAIFMYILVPAPFKKLVQINELQYWKVWHTHTRVSTMLFGSVLAKKIFTAPHALPHRIEPNSSVRFRFQTDLPAVGGLQWRDTKFLYRELVWVTD